MDDALRQESKVENLVDEIVIMIARSGLDELAVVRRSRSATATTCARSTSTTQTTTNLVAVRRHTGGPAGPLVV
jgi:hypothetical protein